MPYRIDSYRFCSAQDAIRRISSFEASAFIKLARWLITKILSGLYPRVGSRRSSDGLFGSPPGLPELTTNSMPNIGQVFGILMSSNVILNSRPFNFAPISCSC